MTRNYSDVKTRLVLPENLKKIPLKTYEKLPGDFKDLLIAEGVGPSTIRVLALILGLIYGKMIRHIHRILKNHREQA